MTFVYVYILQSVNHPEHYYVGHTEDLRQRLKRHNTGEVPHIAEAKGKQELYTRQSPQFLKALRDTAIIQSH